MNDYAHRIEIDPYTHETRKVARFAPAELEPYFTGVDAGGSPTVEQYEAAHKKLSERVDRMRRMREGTRPHRYLPRDTALLVRLEKIMAEKLVTVAPPQPSGKATSKRKKAPPK